MRQWFPAKPGLITPWRRLDSLLFLVFAIGILTTTYRMRVYYWSVEIEPSCAAVYQDGSVGKSGVLPRIRTAHLSTARAVKHAQARLLTESAGASHDARRRLEHFDCSLEVSENGKLLPQAVRLVIPARAQ